MTSIGKAAVPSTTALEREDSNSTPSAAPAALADPKVQAAIRAALATGTRPADIATLTGVTLVEVLTVAFPPCPSWCEGSHLGNKAEQRVDGRTYIADQMHSKTLAEFVAVDADSFAGSRTVNVRLFIDRYDTVDMPDEPIRTDASVEFVHEILDKTRIIRASMTPAQLRTLAATAFQAAALLDEALEVEGR